MQAHRFRPHGTVARFPKPPPRVQRRGPREQQFRIVGRRDQRAANKCKGFPVTASSGKGARVCDELRAIVAIMRIPCPIVPSILTRFRRDARASDVGFPIGPRCKQPAQQRHRDRFKSGRKSEFDLTGPAKGSAAASPHWKARRGVRSGFCHNRAAVFDIDYPTRKRKRVDSKDITQAGLRIAPMMDNSSLATATKTRAGGGRAATTGPERSSYVAISGSSKERISRRNWRMSRSTT